MIPRATEPLWFADAAPAPYPQLDADLEADVAVVGAGIAGVTTAYLLARDGARVAVLERGTVGGGATGSTTAKVSALQQTKLTTIRRLHGADGAASYARASVDAIDWMEQTIAEHAIDSAWQRLPAYTYAAREDEVTAVQREAETLREAGLDAELTTDTPLPFDVPAAVRLDRQAQLHPLRYVRALAAEVVSAGSHVFEGTPVLQVREGEPCRVETETGPVVTARDVVVATNYPLLDRGLYFARMEATRSYLVAARVRAGAPDGMLISAGEPTRSLRSYTDDAGTWLLVGGEGHTTGASKAQPTRYGRLEAFAREHYDVVEIPYRWSTQDGMPTDSLPYVGPYTPRSRHLYVNAGGQKWGMTNATIGARILADRIAGREHPLAARWDPNRATLRSAPEVAKAQARVSLHFVGDRLLPAEAGSSADVPPGEARVVRSGLGKVGVFRDDDGGLHAVSLRCTHLGCLVRFNDADRSWDCPCHGSRFDVDGAVLAGPATRPLDPPA